MSYLSSIIGDTRQRKAAGDAHLLKMIGEIETAARKATHATVKALARNYARHTLLLDHVQCSASLMSLPFLYRTLKARLAFRRSVECLDTCSQTAMNIRAAMVAARYLMLCERAEARLEAAE